MDDPAIRSEERTLYIQIAFSAVAVAFFICCMVFGYLPPVAAIPLIVAVMNQWLRSPIDAANNNIARIQAMRVAEYHPVEVKEVKNG